MGRTVQITFDAADPHTLVAWWADLLGYRVEDHHDRVVELLAAGHLSDADVVELDGRKAFADAATAIDPDGPGPRLYVQRVPESKTAKNRVHLDVRVGQDDLDSEVERVKGRGASFVDWGSHPGYRWAVMRDPEGNEFCLS
jgi:catechol 2,3-dioxygenase-like lactoylglutathione lyase family enzyme